MSGNSIPRWSSKKEFSITTSGHISIQYNQSLATGWQWISFLYFLLLLGVHQISNTSGNRTILGLSYNLVRCGSRIWSRGAPGSEAKSCRCSEKEWCEWSEQIAAGVQGLLKGPGSFWVFNAQICILPHSRDSFPLLFNIYFNTKSW